MKNENLNWYKTARVAEALYQEAGLKEWLGIGLMSAILAVMSGTAIWSAAQRYKVSEEELQNALNNKEVVSRIESVMNRANTDTYQSPEWDNINRMLAQQPEQPQQHQTPVAQPSQSKTEQTQIKPEQEKTEKKPMKKELTADQKKIVDYLARTLWAEARGEGQGGLKAVLSVILNRAKQDPNKIISVIKQPHQFESWNNGTPKQGSGQLWEDIVNMSNQAVSGNFTPTVPYKSFFNPKKAQPKWAYQKGELVTPNSKIGNHVFLNPFTPKSPKSKSVKRKKT